MNTSKILITCPKGIPSLLKQELLSLGFPVISEQIAGVETAGTFDDTLQFNLRVRTGHRVLFLVQEFTANNPDDLYQSLSGLSWEDFIPEDGYLCVTSSVATQSISDSRFATLRCKDAIVDRVRAKQGRRPDSGPQRDRSVVHLHWKDDRVSVYLDTSGEPLSRRGYRKIPLGAPMQETLAAAVVLATGWDGSTSFINPMCGSGTLAIEAALIGLNRAPGLLRNNFGFMHIKGFKESLWNDLREKAKQDARKRVPGKIIATDSNPDAVVAARKNAATAGVEHLIEFGVCNFSETTVPDGGGVVVLNPEYGERMGEVKHLTGIYNGIGDYFKQKCKGCRGYVFTGNSLLAKQVKLKPAKTLQFYNSGIECRLLEYDLYEGSRKYRKPKLPPF
jgi:putative N6-adenine-specific DNA methylase